MNTLKACVCIALVLCFCLVAAASDQMEPKKSKKADIVKIDKAEKAARKALQYQIRTLKSQIKELDALGEDSSNLQNALRELRGTTTPRNPSPRLDEVQGGDTCEDAINVYGLPYEDYGDNFSMNDDYDSECGSSGGADIVYTYTPSVNQTISISTCGRNDTDYDTVIDVYDHCPTAGSSTIDCSDDDCTEGDVLSCVSGLDVEAGVTYYIILDAYGSWDTGNYVLHIIEGSDCAGLVEVECFNPVPGGDDTFDATLISSLPFDACDEIGNYSDNYDSDCASTGGYDAVYKYETTSAMSLDVELCGSDFDTELYILDNSENVIVCNDDNCDDFSGNGLASALYDIELASAAVYYIVVDAYSYDYDSGVYLLHVDGEEITPDPAAANADCSTPEPLAIPGSVTASTDSGSIGTGEIFCDTEPEAKGLWYSVIGDGNLITATTCSPVTDYDTKINVYTGDCADLVCITGDDDDDCEVSDENVSRAAFCSEVGVEYLIFVNGYDGETGTFELIISSAPAIECSGQCECQTMQNSFCYEDPISIPDIGEADSMYVTINQPFAHIIEEIRVCMDITHPNSRELSMSVVSPAGTVVVLHYSNSNNFGADWTCTTWDDNATRIIWQSDAPHSHSIRPNGELSSFAGEEAMGDWKLYFYDPYVGNAGTLNWVCITFMTDEILPVELTSFDAVPGDRQITLNWSTASENDNDHFDIIRDNTTVGRIPAANSPTGGSYTWSESNLTNGQEYTYTLYSVDMSGAGEAIGTVSATPTFNAATITEYALHQNYPNPFNPSTSIVFDLVESGYAKLSVYNTLGQTVATLVDGQMTEGRHTVSFNAEKLPSGLYFYRMDAGNFDAVKKMILMK